jgi:hypothetical protein
LAARGGSHGLLVIGLAVTIGGCGPPKTRLATPPVDVSPRLAEADALITAGCFDCLRDALATYQAVRTVVGAPPAGVEVATEGVVRAAGLLALREREPRFVDDGYLQIAKDSLAARSCTEGFQPCQPVSQILDIVDLLPTRSAGTIGRVPSSDAQLERLQQFYRNRQSWPSLVRDAAGQDSLTAYAWLSFICGTSEGLAMTLDAVLAPVRAMADTPLLMFKRASCFFVQRAQLETLLTEDPRFVEVAYLLGQYATGQRKLDEADRLFQQAYAWHPQWPVPTLAIANVALTAEEFDRIERIKASKAPPARQARQIARREQQIASGRRVLATSSFNTAVAYYTLSRKDEARQFAERVRTSPPAQRLSRHRCS